MITHFDHQCLDHFAEWNSVMKSRLTEKGFHNYVCHKCDQEEKGKQLGRLIYTLYKHTHISFLHMFPFPSSFLRPSQFSPTKSCIGVRTVCEGWMPCQRRKRTFFPRFLQQEERVKKWKFICITGY